jgi:hypothetical protein
MGAYVTYTAGPVKAGTLGTTVYMPNGATMPTVTTPNMRIKVKSGTGVFAANTTVTAIQTITGYSVQAFTVSTTPTTALSAATICGGTCAFFDHASSTTTYTVAKSGGTDYWNSGFMCLSGTSVSLIQAVTSVQATSSTWTEVVN